MAKFCGNCGTKLNDDAAFCTNCGTPCKVPVPAPAQQSAPQPVPDQAVDQQADQTNPQSVIPESSSGGNFIPNANPEQPNGIPNSGMPAYNVQYGIGGGNIADGTAVKKPVNKKLLAVGGIVLGLIILLIIILSVTLSGGCEDPLDNYVKVLEKGDAKAYKECTAADKMGDITEAVYGSSLGKYTDLYYAEQAQDLREDFIDDFGADAKVKYKVVSKQEIPESQINVFNAATSLLDSDIKASKGYTLTVTFTYSGSLDKDIDTVDIDVIKINGDWVFADDEPDGIYPY